MTSFTLGIAESVIEAASRGQPADRVLQAALKAERLPAGDAALVANCVFAYYRWFKWIPERMPLKAGLQQALELADRFRSWPAKFSDTELINGCVPDWASREWEIDRPFAVSMQTPPPLWLRSRSGNSIELIKQLRSAASSGPGWLSDCIKYTGNEDLFRSDAFKQGTFEIQDIASQLVSILSSPQPGQTWWDACAGEGGKTLHLSDLMQNKGLIWATDRADWRLQKLKRRAKRAGVFNYRIALWNGGSALPTRTRFDGVLVDAPCSGAGTWRRNPHARWTTSLEDVRELAELQKSLLRNVANSLKPGGRLVYSVCTLTAAETSQVADSFDAEAREFEPLSVPDPLLADRSSSRFWFRPEQTDGNGMFVAIWKRTGALPAAGQGRS